MAVLAIGFHARLGACGVTNLGLQRILGTELKVAFSPNAFLQARCMAFLLPGNLPFFALLLAGHLLHLLGADTTAHPALGNTICADLFACTEEALVHAAASIEAFGTADLICIALRFACRDALLCSLACLLTRDHLGCTVDAVLGEGVDALFLLRDTHMTQLTHFS